ncbi:RluA family pseudouridine synthase [Alicyclobacillus tolerans]|uniref:RluA family pseudouridine synthase n=1 Tax=Alicyclobacillus tolerans TaxID=90970 RepID=UPI001F3B109B|nr:RluA family pseudouridine synthase [Alicyclobacillus tolerans]MCF8566123.1 RluA family pseudouridine synthase [Alicyclobacillus tolerans]
MDVNVVGNGLVVNPGKAWVDREVYALLSDGLLLPQGYIKQMFLEHRVHSGTMALNAHHVLKPNQRLRLEGGVEEELPTATKRPEMLSTEQAEVDLLYEDDHMLIANKPAHLLVHAGTGEDLDTLDDRVVWHFVGRGIHREVRHVHRLDRDTSGAVLYATHAYSARALDQMLADRQIHRKYLALVRGRLNPPSGVVDLPIGRDRHVSGRYRVSSTGKPAVTHYDTLAVRTVGNDAVSLVQCELTTGRTHQIRVHLSAMGCPVLGDRLYGGGNGVGLVRWETGHALHAQDLYFLHPYTKQEVMVHAPLPENFSEAAVELKLDTYIESD